MPLIETLSITWLLFRWAGGPKLWARYRHNDDIWSNFAPLVRMTVSYTEPTAPSCPDWQPVAIDVAF